VLTSTRPSSAVASASSKSGRPTPAVPSLLGGLLADDPGLGNTAARALVEELVPRWWLERRYHRRSQGIAWREASELVEQRLRRGRHWPRLRARFRAARIDYQALAARANAHPYEGWRQLVRLWCSVGAAVGPLLKRANDTDWTYILLGSFSLPTEDTMLLDVHPAVIEAMTELGYTAVQLTSPPAPTSVHPLPTGGGTRIGPMPLPRRVFRLRPIPAREPVG